MERTYRLHDVVTGAPISLPLRDVSSSWSQSMSTLGRGKHVIPLRGTPFGPAAWRAATGHWARVLVERWDGVPVYAGVIQDRDFDDTTRDMHLSTVTVDAFFPIRYPFGVGGFVAAADFHITAASMRAALELTVQRAIANGGQWVLPFRFHHIGEPGSFTQTFKKHDWKTTADIIDLIRRMMNGPDLAFIPFYDEGEMLRWDVVAGNPRIPGPTIDLPLSVRKPRASGLWVRESGKGMVSGVFARGEGFGPDRKIGLAGFYGIDVIPHADIPVRDVAIDVNDIGDETALTSRARAKLRDGAFAVKQLEFALHVEDRKGQPSFPVTDLRLGARLNARHSGNELHDPYTQELYVTALSYDSANPFVFQPEVQAL